ncbi:hypothetical protein C8J57DRAFT_1330794 [Mycena rebaudengoi]|nr:hypothetical protein C8J57DRAFT_1330794 [Mycena rebaudengoi]
MVFGRTTMSRRLLFRYILIFSSFFAEIRPVLPSISEKVSIPLSPESASFLSRHSKALPRHQLWHPWPAMVISTSYFDPTAPTYAGYRSHREIHGNSSPKQIREPEGEKDM